MILHIGDGAAVVRLDGNWTAPSWPAHGEYASQTFFVTDDPAPQLRITRLETPVDAAAVFSDGIERLVLDFASQTAPAPFFDRMMKPFASAIATGRDQKLSGITLKRYLDSDRINQKLTTTSRSFSPSADDACSFQRRYEAPSPVFPSWKGR